MSKKQPCAYCGGLVEEFQHAPFPGHNEGCKLREEWLKHGHYPRVELDHLEAKVVALTAENERLRADIATAYKSRDEAVERANQYEFHTGPDLRADLANLTAENGRLRRAGKNAIVFADELRAEVVRLAADAAELEGALQGSREAMAVCVASENRAVAELARVTGERDALRWFAEEMAERDCNYGDQCPTFGSRHGQCSSCRARAALAACKDVP